MQRLRMNQSEKLQSRYVTVNGTLMHARVAVNSGSPGRTPIILVHGLVISSRYMVPIAELLARYHDVYAVDLPGYGKSGEPGKILDLPALADALCAWMDGTGLAEATMLGNSFGCQVIAEFALRHPHRLDRAIFVGPTVEASRRSLPQQALRLLYDSWREHPSLILLHLIDYRAAGLRRALGTIRIALADQIEKKLPYLAAETLVVRGTRDPIVSQGWVEELTRLLPRGRLALIPGAPHALNYSAPVPLARAIRIFLESDNE